MMVSGSEGFARHVLEWPLHVGSAITGHTDPNFLRSVSVAISRCERLAGQPSV